MFKFSQRTAAFTLNTLLLTTPTPGDAAQAMRAPTGNGLAIALSGGSAARSTTSGSILLGASSGDGPRRSGLAISADVHLVFLSEETIYSLTFGLGTEWY